MKISSTSVMKAVFVCALSAHPAAEAIRRFFLYSNALYAVADTLVFVSALFAFRLTKPKNVATPLLLLTIYVLWGVICLLIDQSSPMLIFVGLRPLVLGACAYVIATSFFRVADAPLITMLHIITFLVILSFSVALFQIYSGVDAGVNQLPDAAGVEGGGRGDYAANGEVLEGFFRPTSIFMHTGRLGQFAFMTALLIWVTLLLSNDRKNRAIWPSLMCGFLVLLSGQRSAFLFLIIAILWLLIRSGNTKMLMRLGLVCIFFVLVMTQFMNGEIIDLISSRFLSVFSDSSGRFEENSSGVLVALDQFLIFGKGIGFFTFGSKSYGGDVYYDYMSRFGGGGENAWLRIHGETALPGLLVFVLLIGWYTAHSFKRFRISCLEEGRVLHFVAGYSAIALAAWSFTHDIFSNYLTMMQLFFFFGASSGYWAREKAAASRLRLSND